MICRRLELPVPEGIQGTEPGYGEHPVIAETYPLPSSEQFDGDWRALFEGDLKLLWNSRGPHQLYDLARDPGETLDLAARSTQEIARLRRRVRDWQRQNAGILEVLGQAEATIDEESEERLRALGSERQVLCITHLPQVASLAAAHFRVEKKTAGEGTTATVEQVGGEALVAEIVRMLGAEESDEAADRHARELLAA